jgi:hypothetical protein
MVAPGITAPWGSVTVPVMVPELVFCAKICDPEHKRSAMSVILRKVRNGRREVSRIVESPLKVVREAIVSSFQLDDL